MLWAVRAADGHCRLHHQDVFGVEAHGDALQRDQAADQQAAAGEQDQRQRDLADHQPFAHASGAVADDAPCSQCAARNFGMIGNR